LQSPSRTLLIPFFAVFLLALPSCSSKKQGVNRKGANHLFRDGAVVTKVERMPGSGTRCGEVAGIIDAPRERVWKIISDYNAHKDFMPNILESFMIRPEALELVKEASPRDLPRLEDQLRKYRTDDIVGDIVYFYGMGDFPWPMADRRYILKIVRDRERYTIHATMVIGQMKVNESSWELKPYGPDGSKTVAKYTILLDPGIPVPGFMLNIAVNSTLPEVIEVVRRRLKGA